MENYIAKMDQRGSGIVHSADTSKKNGIYMAGAIARMARRY
jgi:hypothetical protein